MNLKTRFCLLLSLATSIAAADPAKHGEPPVKAPFLKGEDSLCVNDWWERPTGDIIDLKVPRDQVVCFGIYTVHNRMLKLTAQLYPLFPKETREVRLEVRKRRCLDRSRTPKGQRPRLVHQLPHRRLG